MYIQIIIKKIKTIIYPSKIYISTKLITELNFRPNEMIFYVGLEYKTDQKQY